MIVTHSTDNKGPANLVMAYYQHACDSYFVESHEDRQKRYRDEVMEREKLARRQTQLAIAEELSQLASHEYQADILQHMEDMEVKRLASRNLLQTLLTSLFRAKHCQM